MKFGATDTTDMCQATRGEVSPDLGAQGQAVTCHPVLLLRSGCAPRDPVGMSHRGPSTTIALLA